MKKRKVPKLDRKVLEAFDTGPVQCKLCNEMTPNLREHLKTCAKVARNSPKSLDGYPLDKPNKDSLWSHCNDLQELDHDRAGQRLDPPEILKRLLDRLRVVRMLAEKNPDCNEHVRILEIRVEAQRQRIAAGLRNTPPSKPPSETFDAKLARLKLARAECGRLLALMRRTPVASAVSVAIVERRLSYLSLAIRTMRETGQIETGLPSVEEIRAEVIREMNSGEYAETLQRSKQEMAASFFARPMKPKL